MRFADVQSIFHRHVHRRYHRHCRELCAQLICLNINIKSAYLFDLFPFSIEEMRSLLNSLLVHLPFRSIILKYSINDLIILNSSHLSTLINASSSVLLIDLTDMTTTTDCHPMLDKIRTHLSWIDQQAMEQIDFDDETSKPWADLIHSLNHTTVFGYLLGYPLIYFYSSDTFTDVTTLKNFRLSVKLEQFDDQILLYSFSYPLHSSIEQKQIECVVQQWFSSLSEKMNSLKTIENYRLEHQIREQATWCL